MDWEFLFHPLRTAKDAWKRPRAKPSLFHYIEAEPKIPFSWKEFFRDLFTTFKNPLFIPSVFSDPEGLVQEQARGSRALANGIYMALNFALTSVSTLLVGLLSDKFGLHAAFIISALVMLTGMPFVLKLPEKAPPPEQAAGTRPQG